MRINVLFLSVALGAVFATTARADTFSFGLDAPFVSTSFTSDRISDEPNIVLDVFEFISATPFQFQITDGFNAGDAFRVEVSFFDPVTGDPIDARFADVLTDEMDPEDEDMMDMWTLLPPGNFSPTNQLGDYEAAFADAGFHRGAVNYFPLQNTRFQFHVFGTTNEGDTSSQPSDTSAQLLGVRVAPVPEPASVALMCSAGLLILRRRRR